MKRKALAWLAGGLAWLCLVGAAQAGPSGASEADRARESFRRCWRWSAASSGSQTEGGSLSLQPTVEQEERGPEERVVITWILE